MSLTVRNWDNDNPPQINAEYLNELDTEVRRLDTEKISNDGDIENLQTQIDNLTSGGATTYNPSAVDAKDAVAYSVAGFIHHDKPLIHPENYYTETATDNEILVSPLPLYDGSKVEDRGTSNITMTTPKDAFSSGANDELLASGTSLTVAKNRADLVITGDTDTIYQCISTSAGTDLTNTSDYRVRTDLAIRNIVLIPVLSPSTFTVLRGWREFTDEDYDVNSLVSDYTEFTLNTDGTVAFEGANYFFVEVRSTRTNGGRYYEPYNPLGYYDDTSGDSWKTTSLPSTTLYGCFQNVGTGSARDDSVIINREYIEGLNGSGANFLPKANPVGKIEKRDYLKQYYKKGGSLCRFGVKITLNAKFTPTTKQFNASYGTRMFNSGTLEFTESYETTANGKEQILERKNIGFMIDAANNIFPVSYYWYSGSENIVHIHKTLGDVTSTLDITGECEFYVMVKSNNLTYNKHRYKDIIGVDYPASWLTWLSNGNNINGFALMVGQDGTDYTSGVIQPIWSEKNLDGGDIYQTSTGDFGATWSEGSVSGDDEENRRGSSIDLGAGTFLIISEYNSKNRFSEIATQTDIFKSGDILRSDFHDINDNSNVINSINEDIGTSTTATEYLTVTKEQDGVIDYTDDATSAPRGVLRAFISDDYFGYYASDDNVLNETTPDITIGVKPK